MQRFCDIFDQERSIPDKLVITNIPFMVDIHYQSDPIRVEVVKTSYINRPLKSRVIYFQELVDEAGSDSDSLYEVSVSTSDGSMRPKLVFPSPTEFSDEETTADSPLKHHPKRDQVNCYFYITTIFLSNFYFPSL